MGPIFPKVVPAEERSVTSQRIKSYMQITSGCLVVLAVLTALAFVLTLPFPFVRKVWFEEYWGYYGILNAALFFFIAERIKHLHLAPVTMGFGMVVFEQALTWHGFYHLVKRGDLHFQSVSFLMLSVLMSGALAVILILAANWIFTYRGLKYAEIESPPPHGIMEQSGHWIIRLMLYGCLFFVIKNAAVLNPPAAFSIIRLCGGAGCFVAFYLIGHRLDGFLKKEKYRWVGTLNGVTDVLVAFGIVVFSQICLPLEQIIRL